MCADAVVRRFSFDAESVLSIVSGYRNPFARWLCMLQAMIDDSGTRDGPHFLLGALIAPVSNWIAFTEEWNAELDERPRVSYFKLQDAVRAVEEFSGAGDRPELLTYKINKLSAIIQKHVEYVRPYFKVTQDFFASHRNIPLEVRLKFRHLSSPYFVAAMIMITAIDKHGFTEPVEIVFDEQAGEGIQVQQWWPDLIAEAYKRLSIPERAHSVQSRPNYKRDQDFAPLQAANSFAWLVHRAHSRIPLDDVVVQPPKLRELLGPIPHLSKLVSARSIYKWVMALKERVHEQERKQHGS